MPQGSLYPLQIGAYKQEMAVYVPAKELCTDTSVIAMARTDDGKLWLATAAGTIHSGVRSFADVSLPSREPVYDFARDLDGNLCAVCLHSLWGWNGERWELLGRFEKPVRSLVYGADGEQWIATGEGLGCAGENARFYTSANSPLLSDNVRCVRMDGAGYLWIATSHGLNLFDRKGEWLAIRGPQGLPCEEVSTIAFGARGERWFGTSRGAVKWANGNWHCYAGRRWLPNDTVLAIAVEPDGTAWVSTGGGLTQIATMRMTLAEKTRLFEERIDKRHNRRGFVTGCHLERAGDLRSFVYDASDNDGLWTALYIAAESFRYAVTGEMEARNKALQSLLALVELEEVTPISGFPARATVQAGEKVIKSHGEWHQAADGRREWKADTSSDEIVGHYFAYAIYHDLVADRQERALIRQVVTRITDHIVHNGYLLIDLDGQPTRWGVWAPQFLNDDPQWAGDKGLNALEVLAALRAAYHITGNERYLEHYYYLVRAHHYALNTINQKINLPGRVNHSDDELAFLAYYTLLCYEDEPDLRTVYLLSLERSWQIERPERNPLWNFIYGALTGNGCDAGAAVQTLQEIPTALIDWRVENSHRADIELDPHYDRFNRPQSTRALPADERPLGKWNANPYRLDGGGEGRHEDDGAYFLLPYWMGRYHRLITEG